MKQQLLQLLAKPFIGSGIGQRFPYLHELYKKMYRTSAAETMIVSIPLDVQLEVQANDTGPGLYLASTGEYEPFETELLLSMLNKNDKVIDIGTHVGYYSLLAAKKLNKRASVISLEAAPANAALLKKNITRNKLQKNIQVVEAAASDKVGTVTFYFSENSSGDHSLTKKTGSKQTVPTTTIDALCKKLQFQPTIIKMDVEGAENQVFAGMKQTLKQKTLRAIFFEVTPNTSDGEKSISLLAKLGFQCQLIDEHNHKLVEYSHSSFKQLAQKYGFINVLAQRNARA